jgi:hypothetical protein
MRKIKDVEHDPFRKKRIVLYVTRLMPRTSLMMRVATRPRKDASKGGAVGNFGVP